MIALLSYLSGMVPVPDDMRTGINGAFMIIGCGICGFLFVWHFCMAVFRKYFESSYGIYVFLILVEWFAVIGPLVICVVSFATHLSQNTTYLNLFLDFANTIMQIYASKYLKNGAHCSPDTYHWCFLIAVVDAFIGLVSCLQLYQLFIICHSRHDIMYPLREQHKQKALEKKNLKTQRTRDREEEMPRTHSKRSHINGRNGVVMHNVQGRIQSHPERSPRTFFQHQDTVRGWSTNTRRETLPGFQTMGQSQNFTERNRQRARRSTYSGSGYPLPRTEPTHWGVPTHQQYPSPTNTIQGRRVAKSRAIKRRRDNQGWNPEHEIIQRPSPALRPRFHQESRPIESLSPSVSEPESDASSYRTSRRLREYEPSQASPKSSYEGPGRVTLYERPQREPSPCSSNHSANPAIILSRRSSRTSLTSYHDCKEVMSVKNERRPGGV